MWSCEVRNIEKGINISHVNIENMGGRDQSQVKIKLKSLKKVKSVPICVPKSHDNDSSDNIHLSVPRVLFCLVSVRILHAHIKILLWIDL